MPGSWLSEAWIPNWHGPLDHIKVMVIMTLAHSFRLVEPAGCCKDLPVWEDMGQTLVSGGGSEGGQGSMHYSWSKTQRMVFVYSRVEGQHVHLCNAG